MQQGSFFLASVVFLGGGPLLEGELVISDLRSQTGQVARGPGPLWGR